MSTLLERVVLASASPRRLELLRSLALDVRVVKSTYGEPALPEKTPLETACVHAGEKLRDVLQSASFAGDVVVAADTVVDLAGTALGKPRDERDAARMLALLSGRTHIVHTAFALAAPKHRQIFGRESTEVTFFALSPREIAGYVASGEPMDKAGGYGIQGTGATLVERINGDFYTVMGFPLARFARALADLDFALPVAKLQ